MSDTANILSLIAEYEKFNKESDDFSLQSFGVWLAGSGSAAELKGTDSEAERSIFYYLHRVAKISRMYSKKIISDLGLSTIDEFYFLFSISKLGTPGKNEVYEDTITEVTTGAQIMKRLLRMNLITEIQDENDLRVKRVALTPEGERIKNEIYRRFGKSVKFKSGNLGAREKKELLKTLRYLNDFHSEILISDPDKTEDELIKKYILG